MRQLGIDVGKNTSIAIFDRGILESVTDILLTGDVINKIKQINKDIYDLLSLLDSPVELYVEGSEIFNTAKGIAAKADVIDLAYLTGAIVSNAVCFKDVTANIVTAKEWKQQLPDEGVKARVNRYLKSIGSSDLKLNIHNYDSIGIVLHHLGLFEIYNKEAKESKLSIVKRNLKCRS